MNPKESRLNNSRLQQREDSMVTTETGASNVPYEINEKLKLQFMGLIEGLPPNRQHQEQKV